MTARPLAIVLAAFMICAPPAAGETPPAEASEPVLGQPAGWTLEEPTETLVGVPESAELRVAPRNTAEVLAHLPAARLALLDWQDRWVKVRFRELEGWVDLDAVPVVSAPIADPSAVLGQALKADPRRLARALAPLGTAPRRLELAAWTLHTDLAESSLLAHLEQLATQLEGVYQERYGLSPSAADERGEVVLYAEKASYDRFNEQAEAWVDRHAAGQAMPGLAVLHAGGRARQEVAATLVHELAHLLNWQTFHRQLPPWLEEGLADDLALISVDRTGRIVPSPLSEGNLRLGRNLGAMLDELSRAQEEKRLVALRELLTLDQAGFTASAQQHYAVAAFWIRFLLRGGDDELASRFRAFLVAVASGQEASFESLQHHLERDLTALEEELHAWLEMLRERFTSRRQLRRR